METKETTIIDVKLDAGKVAEDLQDIARQIVNVKNEQKQLDEEYKAGKVSATEYTKATAAMKDELSWLQKQEKGVIATQKLLTATSDTYSDSLNGQRQKLADMQKAYDQLDKATRESEGGRAFLKQIKEQSDAVKQLEQETGRAQRNVGNYAEGLKDAASQMGVLGSGIANATTRMQQAKTIMSVIAAHPLIAILGALVLVFKKIGDAMKNNAAAMESLTGVFGAFAGVGTIVDKVIEKIAEGLGWIGEKALGLADKLGLLSKEIKEGQAIAKEDLAIQKAQREAALATAEDQKKIAELRAQAADKIKYSAAERIKLLKQASDLEEGISKRQYELAKREYELQVQKNAQSKTSQEDYKKENDLRIAMINAETAYYEKQRSLNKALSEARKQDAAAIKAEAEAQAKIIAESAAKLQALRDVMEDRNRTEIENRIAALNKAKEEELAIAGLTAEEKLQIEQYYAEQVAAVYEADKKAKEQAEREKAKARENARIELGLDPAKTDEELELEKAGEAYAQGLINYEEYEQAKVSIQEKFSALRLKNEEDAVKEAQRLYNQEVKSAASAASGALSALSDLMGAFSEESEEAEAAQKAFALGSIIINQAMSIAEGAKGIAAAMAGAATAAAATGPAAPIMLGVYQAQMVGSVLAVIASVASTITQAKQLFSQADKDAGKFAGGGTVPGTSYTGDKLIAHVNSGEGIYTGTQANNLLQEIANNPLRGANYDAMAAAMAAAVAELPAPVMDYTEFKGFEQNVSTYNEIARV